VWGGFGDWGGAGLEWEAALTVVFVGDSYWQGVIVTAHKLFIERHWSGIFQFIKIPLKSPENDGAVER
jgi:hypothetical protein